MQEATETLRKTPVQKRTRQTLDVLFEATAQLLQSGGAKGLNTNAIAERAGFSIGTLYSYFKDKTSLLRALALREFARQEAEFAETLAAHRALPREAMVRAVVRQGFAPFAGRHRVRRHLLVLFGNDVELQRALHDMVDRMTERLIDAVGIEAAAMPPARRYILVRAALGPIRAAVMCEHRLVATAELEDELVRLVLFLLQPETPSRN
ncbi:putative Transcriptional regulator, TetR family [Bradyrhizobium sp. ORS 375]|uniref:TetR/AcrR family transcriptional regulator n=1 Tax=Bradyrhizobium sp. (strain ORS 375) TaxID=566679 RepID=UPI00024063D8|nr:TetR/AcrR family transcriptional regulator [Bradyrhizobium sp. ORS 375]CCD94488.1 putative Transcriptional regulator, TetR family [Bradyrhizobium sp. ORS 375]